MPTLAQTIFPVMLGKSLGSRASAWQSGGANVHVGGLKEAAFVTAIGFGNGTIINRFQAFVQDCTVKQIKVSVNARAGGTWKFKVFRWNSGTSLFDMVAQQAFIPAATGTQTITLSPGIDVQMGDCPGVYMPDANEKVNLTVTATDGYIGTRYVSGADITTSNAFATTSVREIDIDCLGNRPFLACAGNSIMAGNANQNPFWYNIWSGSNASVTVPGGEPTSEIPNQIRARVPTLQYQNQAKGGLTWNWQVTTGVPACVAIDPRIIVIHSGLNDVIAGRVWADVLADMDSVRALVPATVKLLIDEITPGSAGYASDAQAATIRTFNANYATWCAANNATLVKCHDEMAQIRVSTGELDDLLAAYDQDGRHFTAAGVDKAAEIIRRYL